MLAINEIFYSIQGEGSRVGIPTWFIRFQGCNLNCPWCDTKKARSRLASPMTLTTTEVLEKLVGSCYKRRVVITGGEPFVQAEELQLLCSALEENRYLIAIETNGLLLTRDTIPGSKQIHITVSPKMGYLPTHFALTYCDELKFVIDDKITKEFMLECLRPFSGHFVTLMPEGTPPTPESIQHAIELVNSPELSLWAPRIGARLQWAYNLR